MAFFLNISSGVLAGIMIAIYELVLLPVVDWSLGRICRLMNVRSLAKHGVGTITVSPLPIATTPYVCMRRRDSWIIYLTRLIPFALAIAWEFLVRSESVTPSRTTTGMVMVPGDGAFKFSSSEESVDSADSLDWFCTFGKDVYLQVADGDCTTTKVFSDLGRNVERYFVEEECEVMNEQIAQEVAGSLNKTLVIAKCQEGRYFAHWKNIGSEYDHTLIQIDENRVYVAEVLSEMILESSTLLGGYTSLRGVEIHFKEWEVIRLLRAIMTNSFVRQMGVLKVITAAALVPKDGVTVEVREESRVVTVVSTEILVITGILLALVLLYGAVGIGCEIRRRQRYRLNPVSGASEIGRLIAAGNEGRELQARIVAKVWEEDGVKYAIQHVEGGDEDVDESDW